MTMYKIINDFCIRKLHDEYPRQIPRDEMNADYIQFKKDVVGIGTTCVEGADYAGICLLYTSPSPRDMRRSRMPSSA